MRNAVLLMFYGAIALAAVLIVRVVPRHRRTLEVENAQDVLTYSNERHVPRWEHRVFYGSLCALLAPMLAAAFWPR